MPWRQRFVDFLYKDLALLRERLNYCETHHCEVWETTDGQRKDTTEEYVASLRSRIAEIEQMLVEEGLS